MLFQRIFAKLDKVLQNILSLEEHGSMPGSDGAASEEYYYLFGPRCGLVRADGTLEIGSIFEIVHQYDVNGKLLRRRSRWNLRRRPGDRFVIGSLAVIREYRKSKEPKPSLGGMMN